MSEIKIVRYRLPLAKTFPTTHSKKGDATNFFPKVGNGDKIHTVRMNYEGWKKKIDKINEGLAVLEVYEWTGKPYNSPSKTLFTIERLNYQKIEIVENETYEIFKIDDTIRHDLSWKTVANNDGLCKSDFIEWFKKFERNKDVGIIIHFTDFKY